MNLGHMTLKGKAFYFSNICCYGTLKTFPRGFGRHPTLPMVSN